jgi:DNA-binding transcriptional ArsR family regulator
MHMIEGLFGGATAEKVLLYLANYEEGYAREISECFGVPVSMVQKQLARFEKSGLIISRLRGRVRLYTWNPRYPFRDEVGAVFKKAIRLLPASEKKKFFMSRTRPRRAGKPL